MKVLGILLIAIGIALGVSGTLLTRRTVFYSSTAVVKVVRDRIDLPELSGVANLAAAAGASSDNTIFIETEVAVLKSDATFNQVITQLSLNEVWGQRLNHGNTFETSESSQLLKERLRVQPGSDPSLINITAVSDIAAEAADVANAVARAYCDYRADYRRRRAQTALDVVAEKYGELEKQIATAKAKVDQARQQLDPVLQAMAATNAPTAGSDILRKLHSKYSESLLRYLAASNQLALFPATNADANEIIEQMKSRAEKARGELVEIENATTSEVRRLDLLKAYQVAMLDLEELNQRFAPIKNAVEELKADLRPQSQPPASIIEPATISSSPDDGSTSRNRWMFPGAGGALVLGVGLVFAGRSPRKTPT